jgi:hypothetical protein
MYNVNDPENPTYADTYHVGDSVSFGVRIEDNDLDLKTLVATESLLGSDTPLNGPDEIPLGEQTSQLRRMAYFSHKISGPQENTDGFVAVDPGAIGVLLTCSLTVEESRVHEIRDPSRIIACHDCRSIRQNQNPIQNPNPMRKR